LGADTVTEIVKEHVDAAAELATDDSTSYKKLKQVVKLKRLLLGMRHQLTKEYLQHLPERVLLQIQPTILQ
jgi:hypothetical protein